MKPILKWVGGKTQILKEVFQKFPTTIENYYEICLGGGSVLFELLQKIKAGDIELRGKIYAYDVNKTLIYVYKNIQSHCDELYSTIQTLIKEYNSCKNIGIINRAPETKEEANLQKENYYYWTRKRFNMLEDQTTIEASAMLIFLNKTCFRGLYRCGPNGFNVPYGHYKNPEIINESHLKQVEEIIKNVEFISEDFETSMDSPTGNDFVYIDPPYAPETINSFVGYTEKGFTDLDHKKLFQKCYDLSKRNVKWLMSNANVPIIDTCFPDSTYDKTIILCKRAINAKNPGKKTKEVLIRVPIIS